MAAVSRLAREIARTFHNRERLKGSQFLYAHNRADNTWSCTCHTVGDRIWGPIGKAEGMHPSEFAGDYKRGKFTDPDKLLHLEGWTEVWLYTEEEWKAMIDNQVAEECT